MILLYSHGGSTNHGCEAIVRSTTKILNRKLVLYSSNPADDYTYGLNQIVQVKSDIRKPLPKGSLDYIYAAIAHKFRKDDYKYITLSHKDFFDQVNKGDVYLSIGGDNYCYKGQDVLGYYNQEIHKRGAKTVLWGCSIEPNVLTAEVLEDLKRYDAITVRESLSFEALHNAGLTNIKLCSDPAFQLDKIDVDLPNAFADASIIGINISPLIFSYGAKSLILENYETLINYILQNTNYSIMFVPHVVSSNSDDRTAIQFLYDKIDCKERVFLVDDCTCEELKGYISQCRFFLGARTHSIIAAYSCMVPTLAVGYSVKAKGIAKDIFGEYEPYVLSVQNMSKSDSLLKKMLWIMENEKEIRLHLQNVMPFYTAKAYEGLRFMKEILYNTKV